jgi:RNA exonuclease 1
VENGEGCSHGPHVFSESDPEALHARHAFSFLPAVDHTSPPKLDVAAIDCEMIYTTGGLRVARVSVINGSGEEVLDQLVRMDDGVQVMYINRFTLCTSLTFLLATITLVFLVSQQRIMVPLRRI